METENYYQLLKFSLALITLFLLVRTFLKHLDYRSNNQKLESVSKIFLETITKLSSSDEIERTTGAILIRRFFDKNTEMGFGSTPYAKEAVNVIAAALRNLPTSNFQKILADGLIYAPNLKNIDLQNTNLQNAYLGKQKNKTIDFSGTDFYKSDLTSASFNGVILNKTVFYQAILTNTIFKNTQLKESNFYEANLMGANFTNATLEGSNFTNAYNIPSSILKHLNNNGIYKTNNKEEKFIPYSPKKELKVFISKSNSLNLEQQVRYNDLLKILENKVKIETLERNNYLPFGALGNISRQISGCSGVILIGLEQFNIKDGTSRVNTNESKELSNTSLSTPWNQIEAGMAAMIGLPILILADKGIDEGIFEEKLDDQLLFYSSFSKNLDCKALEKTIDDWYNAL